MENDGKMIIYALTYRDTLNHERKRLDQKGSRADELTATTTYTFITFITFIKISQPLLPFTFTSVN